MDLIKIAFQLENGLKITFRLLTFEENKAVYNRYIAKFDDEPRILVQDLYEATFHFKTSKLRAFCYADAVSLIISLFGTFGQPRALDYFECFILNGRIINDSISQNERIRVLTILKQSVSQNISPNLTALFAPTNGKPT